MRPVLSFIIAALVVVATGCTTTTYVQEFHGEMRNTSDTNQTASVRCDIDGICDGPSIAGGRFVGFDMPASNNLSIYLSYPETSSRHTFHTAPPRVDAWLVYTHGYLDTDLEHEQLVNSGDVRGLRLFGAVQLSGTITETWNDNADFDIAVDLTATNGGPTVVRGEFVGYTKTKFDPGSALIVLGMLFYGEGVYTGNGNPTNLPTIGGPTIEDSHELETPTYRVNISRHPETSFDNAKCTCVNNKDGKTINLRGKTIPTRGRGVFGYIFQNGTTRFLIGCNGELLITEGPNVLLDEQGTWK